MVLLAGCATSPDGSDFDVTLVNVRGGADGGGVGEAALTFTVHIQNASPESAVLTGASHRIYLNGLYLGQGLSNEQVDVARLATAQQEVTVFLSTFKLARAGYRVYRQQNVDYQVRSTLYTLEGGRSRRRTVTHEGTLDLRGLNLPPLPPGSPPL